MRVQNYLMLGYRLARYRCAGWIPGYLLDQKIKRNLRAPTDIIVCVADHFEPAKAEGNRAHERVKAWVDAYRESVSEFRDSDGYLPRHTWFYRFDFLDDACIRELSKAAWDELGEVEFHLHHGFDNQATFRRKIRDGLELAGRWGAMQGIGGSHSFGYIAGNWALNNGTGDPSASGVDDEISVLAQEGCYGDFTFPALGSPAQPKKVNSLYYVDSRSGGRAYDTGTDAAVGHADRGFLIVQGPLVIDQRRGSIEYGAVETFSPFLAERIRNWCRAAVHVRGRPEWLFVKLHTHGMQSSDEFRGERIQSLYRSLISFAKDTGVRMHFVTARELTNMIRAAESGAHGDPGAFRNIGLARPPNSVVLYQGSASTEAYDRERLKVRFASPQTEVSLRTNGKCVEVRAASITAVEVSIGTEDRVTCFGSGNADVRIDDKRVNAVLLCEEGSTVEVN